MAQGGVDTGNAIERAAHNQTTEREADDYRELHVAALEKLDADVRSRHALLPGKGGLPRGSLCMICMLVLPCYDSMTPPPTSMPTLFSKLGMHALTTFPWSYQNVYVLLRLDCGLRGHLQHPLLDCPLTFMQMLSVEGCRGVSSVGKAAGRYLDAQCNTMHTTLKTEA